jgi:hypothetical protein
MRLQMTAEEEHAELRMANVRNAAFWAGVAARDKQLESESLQNHPLLSRLKRGFLSEQAAKGGRAIKADPLTKAIRDIVAANHDISEARLRKALQKIPGISFLDAKDMKTASLRLATHIQFINQRGREAEIPMSALKDRLSRAKAFRAKEFARDK